MLNYRGIFLSLYLFLTAALAHSQVVASFGASTPTSGCAPLVVSFTNTSTGATSYKWDFGNGAPISYTSSSTPSSTYSTPGTYTVTLTAYNGTDSSVEKATGYITVYDVPVVHFTGSPRSGCPGTCVSFSESSTLKASGSGRYLWDFGDGTSDTNRTPTKCFPHSGYYNISLVVRNSRGCTTTLLQDSFVHIFPKPTAAFTGTPLRFCNPTGIATFTNAAYGGTSPLRYKWRFGDGTPTSSTTSPTHSFTTFGNFDVTLIVTDTNSCVDSLVKPGFVTITKPSASFTGPTTACINTPVTFTNTGTSSGVTSTWLYGDGTSGNPRDGNHSYSTAGTYTVKLVLNDGKCTDTAKATIVIKDGPVDSFSFAPREPCPAPINIVFTFKGSSASTYSWNFGDGGTSSAANPTHSYSTNGVYYIILTATGPTGCVSTFSDSIIIRDMLATILASPQDGCAPLSVNFTASIHTSIPFPALYPYLISSYVWDFGDGSPAGSGPLPSHTYMDTGTYVVHLTVTHNPGGCTATTTDTVRVGRRPHASFYPDRDTICAKHDQNFHNTTPDANSYAWTFGDSPFINTDVNPHYAYGDTGTYTVRLIAKYNGCPDTTYHKIVVLPPVASISYYAASPPHPCYHPGLPIHFYDSSSVLLTSHIWYFGDGDSSLLDSPVHAYAVNGIYKTRLIGYNSSTGCTDTDMVTFHVISPHDSVFATSDTAICMNGVVSFKDTLIGASGSLYSWTDIAPDTTIFLAQFNGSQSITDTFNRPGLHTIFATATDVNYCDWSATTHILVGKPKPGFKVNMPVACAPATLLFTDTSTDVPGAYITKRLWTFGNGDTMTSTNQSVNETYKTKGIDSVKIIVTDNIGCKDSTTRQKYITVLKPTANFASSNDLPCKGELVYFYNYSSVDTGTSDTLNSFYWSFGDGDTSMMKSPTHTYNDTGFYTVRLIAVDVRGCRDTLTKFRMISIQSPLASFTMDDSSAICPPLHVQFTSTSIGAVGYYWDMGDTNSYSIANPGHTFTSSRYYTVKLVVTNTNGCKDSTYRHVNIFGYDGALTYSPLAGCAPLTVYFTASISNAPVAIWDFNDGFTKNASGITTTTHTYLTPGAYVPKLILGDGLGCKSGSQGLDTIKVDGVIPHYIAHTPCIGDTVVFTDSSFSYFSPITQYYWSLSGGLTSTANYALNRYFTPGKYPVTLIVTNAHGCKDTLSDSVTIYPLPIIDAGLDTSICVGDAATLVPGGGVSYVWSPDPTLSCTNCTDPQASPVIPTTYTVTGTDKYGCRNTDTVRVSLQTKTTSLVADGGSICQGDTAFLHASGAQQYKWSPADSMLNPNSPDPLAFPMQTTTYTVVAKEGSCTPDTNTTVVNVNPKPVVKISATASIVGGQSTTLQASGSNIVSYLWMPAATLSCSTCSNPVASPTVTTQYFVIGTSDQGCKDTDDVTIKVICDKSQVFIPNAFTPNGDGENDLFYPRGVSITSIKSFRIYNRWGELVFERTGININDEKNGWDGSYNGAPQPPAVYVYVVDAICESGQELILKGDVTIIR